MTNAMSGAMRETWDVRMAPLESDELDDLLKRGYEPFSSATLEEDAYNEHGIRGGVAHVVYVLVRKVRKPDTRVEL